jgi:two-component system, cell cycle sensor histidine kinase and response regulator CckA
MPESSRKTRPARSGRDRAHQRSALWIVLLYALVAGLWIYFSDTILGSVVRNPEAFVRFSVLKGFLFIAVTGTLLYVLIARRIQRIRRVTAALSESEALLRSYVENAPIAILVFDADGRCVGSNLAARELAGADPALRGLRISEILRPVAPGSPPLPGGEIEVERRDGRRIWVNVREVKLTAGGQSLRFCQDVSERIHAAEELRRTNERLIQAEKMEAVGRLAGGVAHDFNNILTAIYGYSDVLRGSLPAGGTAHSFVTEIRRAATRAASLTQQLLAFSRRQELLPRPVDLNGLLRELWPMLQRLIGEDVDIDLDPGDGLWTVRADPARLEQALMNLAVNGRDAMPQGGRLTLRTRNVVLDGTRPGGTSIDASPDLVPGEYAAVTVTDTGTGMDEETRSHLFEPFFTTKDVGKGTGLGLATVYGIVKQSGGSITVRSEPGQGTSFTLYLPRTLEHSEGPQEPEALPASGAGHELILYVEDDEAVRDLVTLVLRKQGYEVLSASNGAEAMQVATPVIDRIALVIADVVMPIMNGRQLVDRLRSLRPDVKFVFTSGYTRDIVDQHDLGEAAAPLIEKPIDSASFLARVRQILDT